VVQTHAVAIQKIYAKLPMLIITSGCHQITHIEGMLMTSMASSKEG
jgi:hypothetical protein